MQHSRQTMKLYKQLRLQHDQRASMAQRWRSWCKRRAAVGFHFYTATYALQVRTTPLSPMMNRVPPVIAGTLPRIVKAYITSLRANLCLHRPPFTARGSGIFSAQYACGEVAIQSMEEPHFAKPTVQLSWMCAGVVAIRKCNLPDAYDAC